MAVPTEFLGLVPLRDDYQFDVFLSYRRRPGPARGASPSGCQGS
ncbi:MULTISPECIES: hypothetical protein [Actinosynnema]|nr:hypothetical protein [Actinosynnema pretiosum]